LNLNLGLTKNFYTFRIAEISMTADNLGYYNERTDLFIYLFIYLLWTIIMYFCKVEVVSYFHGKLLLNFLPSFILSDTSQLNISEKSCYQ